MPQARTTAERETIDLIAPWYSQERMGEDGKQYRTLVRRKKGEPAMAVATDDAESTPTEDDDDEFEWVETLETRRYAEHVTLYRRASHADAKWISRQVNIFKGFNGAGNPKINEAQMTRARTLGYLRRIVEITNAHGVPQPHAAESDFDLFDEAEMNYLDAAIKVLDDPVAPILHEDREKARATAEKIAQREAQGFPISDEQRVDEPAFAAQTAQDHLFRPDQRDLPESGQ